MYQAKQEQAPLHRLPPQWHRRQWGVSPSVGARPPPYPGQGYAYGSYQQYGSQGEAWAYGPSQLHGRQWDVSPSFGARSSYPGRGYAYGSYQQYGSQGPVLPHGPSQFEWGPKAGASFEARASHLGQEQPQPSHRFRVHIQQKPLPQRESLKEQTRLSRRFRPHVPQKALSPHKSPRGKRSYVNLAKAEDYKNMKSPRAPMIVYNRKNYTLEEVIINENGSIIKVAAKDLVKKSLDEFNNFIERHSSKERVSLDLEDPVMKLIDAIKKRLQSGDLRDKLSDKEVDVKKI